MNNLIQSKLKVVFLGEQSTGKTSILTRFIEDKFQAGLGATVGIDFMAKSVIVNKKVLRLQFWDTAGQERFRSLIPNYLRQATLAFIVFDITNEKSFATLPEWFELCNQNMREKSVVVLLGNKFDLEEERQVSEKEARLKASEFNASYYQVSAKTGHMIKETLTQACEQLVTKTQKQPQSPSQPQSKPIQLHTPKLSISNQQQSKKSNNRRCC